MVRPHYPDRAAFLKNRFWKKSRFSDTTTARLPRHATAHQATSPLCDITPGDISYSAAAHQAPIPGDGFARTGPSLRSGPVHLASAEPLEPSQSRAARFRRPLHGRPLCCRANLPGPAQDGKTPCPARSTRPSQQSLHHSSIPQAHMTAIWQSLNPRVRPSNSSTIPSPAMQWRKSSLRARRSQPRGPGARDRVGSRRRHARSGRGGCAVAVAVTRVATGQFRRTQHVGFAVAQRARWRAKRRTSETVVLATTRDVEVRAHGKEVDGASIVELAKAGKAPIFS